MCLESVYPSGKYMLRVCFESLFAYFFLNTLNPWQYTFVHVPLLPEKIATQHRHVMIF